MNVAQILRTISTAPRGAQVGAFFDLDGTLVNGYTAGAVYRDRIRHGHAGLLELARLTVAAIDSNVLGGSPHGMNGIGLAAVRGRTTDTMTALAERVFTEDIAASIRPEARDLVRAHLRRGHTVVIASSATRIQIEPLARDLGIRHIVCTEWAQEKGVLTGDSATGVRWGEQKAAAIRTFAREHHVNPAGSFGYADGWEDIPFLGSLGRPYAVNPHEILRRAAGEYGWPVLTLRDPRSPGTRAYLGTVAALLGVNDA